MLQHFLKAWTNNRGNLLLILGTIAGILMCLVWYFQLVPEVRLITRNFNSSLISRTQLADQSQLVVTLRIPAQSPSAEAQPALELQAIVELHLPTETLQPDQLPLLLRSVALRNDGKPQVVVFTDVQPRTYAVLAYIDLNQNEKFDFDDAGKATEPYRLSRGTGEIIRETDRVPHPLDLEPAGVEAVSKQATLVEFDFRQAAKK